MPVRPNMQPLIDYLRREGNAAAEDSETYEGVGYWSDQQLQDILDQVSERKVGYAQIATSDGTIYKIDAPRHYYPDPDTIVLLDSNVEVVSASVTFDILRNEYNFTDDPEITYIQAVFVNFWDAAAQLWSEKAAHRFGYVDNKSGQNALKSQQEYEHCVERMQYYRNKSVRRWRR